MTDVEQSISFPCTRMSDVSSPPERRHIISRRSVAPVSKRAALHLLAVLLLLCSSGIHAFLLPYARILLPVLTSKAIRTNPLFISNSNSNSNNNDNNLLERFHVDLRKVLTPRDHVCSEYFVNNLDRHQRPIILPYDVDGAEKSYKMLHHMVRIGCWSEESFQIVMRAFLQRGRVRWKLGQTETFTCAADQLELLLLELEQIIEVTETISEETMRLVLQAYAVCATPRGERNYAMRAEELLQRMEHTTESLLLIIHAWAWQQANKEMGDCAKKAEEYLIQLEELTDDPVIRQQAYDYVLEAWSKSKDAPEKANAIFEKRQKLGHVSMDCYTNIILSWSKSPGGAQRANDLLNEMLDMFHRGIFPAGQEPELIAFNSVITSWGKAQRPDTGELILHLLEETSRKCTKLVPNVLTYNAVIHAHYLSSNSKVALERGQALVQYMEVHALEEPEIQPDIFTYNTLMKVRGSCIVLLCPSCQQAINISWSFIRLGSRVVTLNWSRTQKGFYLKWNVSLPPEMIALNSQVAILISSSTHIPSPRIDLQDKKPSPCWTACESQPQYSQMLFRIPPSWNAIASRQNQMQLP